MSALLATAALPLLLTGCMAVRPDVSPASGSRPAQARPDAGHQPPRPVVREDAPSAGPTPEPLPTAHLDVPDQPAPAGPRTAADRTKPPERQTLISEDDSVGARPRPQPGLAAGQHHEQHAHHHGPAARPAGGSPGWPGAGPNACAAAASLGIFAPNSSADHACQNLAQHERPYLHGHHGP